MTERDAASAGAVAVDAALLLAWPLPVADAEGDKESRGRVVVVAGSREMPGAAALAATAALRAGAGKVVVVTGAAVAPALAVALPEARVVGIAETAGFGLDPEACGACLDALVDARTGAVVVGPGMQDEMASLDVARRVLAAAGRHSTPVIVDAMALDALRDDGSGGPVPRPPLVMTPHAGEMAHLLGRSKEAICAAPEATARDAAARWRAVVALKGATTHLAAADGRAWRHDDGDVGLATAGSGDVLAGIVGGLIARGAAVEQAAVWGVALHAAAGRALAARVGRLGFLARELPAEIPRAMQRLAER